MSDASRPTPAQPAGRRIIVRLATPADMTTMAKIHFAAFGIYPINRLAFPGGPTPDNLAKFAAALFDTPPNPNDGGETVVTVAELVSDDAAPEVVGYSKWRVFRRERTREEWDAPRPPMTQEQLGEGANPEPLNAFIDGLNGTATSLTKGEAHLRIGILACTPKYHRLGAGTALMRHALDVADAEGLPARIEATPAGWPLYRRLGFGDIATFDQDITGRWGLKQAEGEDWGEKNGVEKCGPCPEGHFRNLIMRRPAKGEAATV